MVTDAVEFFSVVSMDSPIREGPLAAADPASWIALGLPAIVS
ncbi:hypothetical protein [Streptomyces sp. NPDC005799]